MTADGWGEIHLHFHTGKRNRKSFRKIQFLLNQLLVQGNVNMSAISDAFDALNTKVTALETTEDAAIALLVGLKAALDAALASGGDPAAVVAAVQAVVDRIGTDTDKLAAGVAANTPT